VQKKRGGGEKSWLDDLFEEEKTAANLKEKRRLQLSASGFSSRASRWLLTRFRGATFRGLRTERDGQRGRCLKKAPENGKEQKGGVAEKENAI
jgi:hypothetical protein